jgi:hypothetical protein
LNDDHADRTTRKTEQEQAAGHAATDEHGDRDRRRLLRRFAARRRPVLFITDILERAGYRVGRFTARRRPVLLILLVGQTLVLLLADCDHETHDDLNEAPDDGAVKERPAAAPLGGGKKHAADGADESEKEDEESQQTNDRPPVDVPRFAAHVGFTFGG